MKKKILLIFCLIVLLTIRGVPREENDNLGKFNSMTSEQKIQFIKDVIIRGPFLKKSADPRLKPYTIGKFFNNKIYKKLYGNDILGYIYDQGFAGISDKISVKIFKTTDRTRKYKSKFINILIAFLKKNKIRFVKESNVEMGIAMLDVDDGSSGRSLPGVLIEAYLKNNKTNKFIFHRIGTGKKSGVEAAFYDLMLIVLNSPGN
ncbi:MAG: hypothetical protein ABFR75_05610 [Acidobacteriota bacterium]